MTHLPARPSLADQIARDVLTERTQGLLVDSPAFRAWFSGSKVVDAEGHPLPVFHGTGRPDRVGKRFRKSRATSGPMPYFTDSPKAASGYAEGKADTSLADQDTNYPQWFTVTPKGMRRAVPLDQAWYYLPPEERARIAKLAGRVTTDDTGEEIILADEGHTNGNGAYDWELKQARGNALKALIESWLTSGSLFDQEEEFLKVLRHAGMTTPVRFADPQQTYPFVYKVYLRIHNPLVSTAIPQRVLDALGQQARRQRAPAQQWGADAWDKRTQDPREWMRRLLDDIEQSDGMHSWTTIPDWVTKTLIALGYDGIKDTGGKNGGPGHIVWIPFDDRQVKSALSNQNFDPSKPGIHEDAGVRFGRRGSAQGEARSFGMWLNRLFWARYPDAYDSDSDVFNHEYTDDGKGRPLRYRMLVGARYLGFVHEMQAQIAAEGWHLTVETKRGTGRWQLVFEPIETATVPRTGVFWHVTPVANVAAILRNGLHPRLSRFGLSYPQPRSYLIRDEQHAARMVDTLLQRDHRHAEYALLRIDLRRAKGIRLHTDPELSTVAVYTTEPIPPDLITLAQEQVQTLPEAVTVAPIADEPNPALARCTTVSCNAILANFRKAPIRGAGEMPRTGRDCLNLFGRRGLTYRPENFDPPVTVRQFVQTHQRGSWYLGTQGHALAVVDGALFDTERKGLDGRIVRIAAQILPS